MSVRSLFSILFLLGSMAYVDDQKILEVNWAMTVHCYADLIDLLLITVSQGAGFPLCGYLKSFK
jgi:hypothetical protein